MKRVDNMLDNMLKNKTRLALKMFIILWFLLFLQVILKLTFNYWQPYVIPNETLQSISDYIDNHRILKDSIDLVYCYINAVFVVLAGIKVWKFKNKLHYLIIFGLALATIISQNSIVDTILTIICTIIYPLILDIKNGMDYFHTILILFLIIIPVIF